MKTREVTVKDLTGADIPALLLVCPECWREAPESLEQEIDYRIEWAKRLGWEFTDGPEGSHYIVFRHPGKHERGLRFFTNGKPEDTMDRLTIGGIPVFNSKRGEAFHLYVVGATDEDPMGHNHLQCISCNASFCQGACDK